MKKLALFDLDHTLLPIDSDHEWGEFLVRTGRVDPVEHKRRNDAFFEQYKAGTLDPVEYLEFALGTLARWPPFPSRATSPTTPLPASSNIRPRCRCTCWTTANA